MNQHRENLQKLIKMMKGVYNESVSDNKAKGLLDSESERYISYEKLLSIRELTRMFIEELNSEYLQCTEGDEIVGYIEDTIEWLQSAYDFTIEHNAGSTGVKSLKVCSQALSDYKKVYEEAKKRKAVKVKGKCYATLEDAGVFEFGKRNLPKVEFNDTGMTVNEGTLAYIHNDPPIINPEYTKKIDEMYEWIKNQKEYQLTEDKLIKAMGKYFDKERRRFKE